MSQTVLVVLHLVGACIWTGGHVVLSTAVLPQALRQRNPDALRQFERGYEHIGIPAMLIQVITGLVLSAHLNHWPFHALPGFSPWILVKWGLLVLTLALGLHARLVLFPKLTAHNMAGLAGHIIAVTFVSLAWVVVGVFLHRGVVV
jgi:putative copper export protein